MKKLMLTAFIACVIISSAMILCAGLFDVNVPKAVWLVWTVCCLVSAGLNFYNLYAHNKKDK